MKQMMIENSKKIPIILLYLGSVIIFIIGSLFAIYSIIIHLYFTIMGSPIHGSILGVAFALIGVRYFISVRRLQNEIYYNSIGFSWGNFKHKKLCKKYVIR